VRGFFVSGPSAQSGLIREAIDLLLGAGDAAAVDAAILDL
jgi:hypothetical protein